VSHDIPDGMVHLGYVAEPEQELLRRVLAAGREKMAAAWAASSANREIFWINLWRRLSKEEPIALAGAAELDRWVRELVGTAYAGEGVELEGYGFISNPVESKSQLWHVDYYTMDYSNLFIPLTQLTPENCTQYAVLPAGTPLAARQALAKLEFVDVNGLVDSFDYVSVRQMLARPFLDPQNGFWRHPPGDRQHERVRTNFVLDFGHAGGRSGARGRGHRNL